MSLDEEEKEEIKDNPSSKIVFLDGIWALAGKVLLQIPWEYGMSGVAGKRYDAIKDFLEWNNFEVKEWVPIFVRAGEILAQNLQKR